jgi:hypothetical protein
VRVERSLSCDFKGAVEVCATITGGSNFVVLFAVVWAEEVNWHRANEPMDSINGDVGWYS